MVEKLCSPSDDDHNEHKKLQLRELAALNGTLKEVSECYLCGMEGHTPEMCPNKVGTGTIGETMCLGACSCACVGMCGLWCRFHHPCHPCRLFNISWSHLWTPFGLSRPCFAAPSLLPLLLLPLLLFPLFLLLLLLPPQALDVFKAPEHLQVAMNSQYERDVARVHGGPVVSADAEYKKFLSTLGGAPPPELMGMDGHGEPLWCTPDYFCSQVASSLHQACIKLAPSLDQAISRPAWMWTTVYMMLMMAVLEGCVGRGGAPILSL
jgi:hypothetical protein